jgi:oligoribonuclease
MGTSITVRPYLGGGAGSLARSRAWVASETMLAWIDLEMTGLDPVRHTIVEIASLVTDDELQIVAVGPDLVVHAEPAQLEAMDEVVRTMHETSGLLDEMARSTLTLEDAGRQTLEFLKAHVPQPGTVPLCGNSIGTDRRFLAAQLPDIEHWLHYRSIDVSTIKELARRWYPDAHSSAPAKKGAHRALDDIRESVAELEYYRKAIFAVPPEPATPDPAPTAGEGGRP